MDDSGRVGPQSHPELIEGELLHTARQLSTPLAIMAYVVPGLLAALLTLLLIPAPKPSFSTQQDRFSIPY